jgi:capsule polysaccharide modification protein KpsS
MDRIGLGPKDGFDSKALKHYSDAFRKIVKMAHRYYMQAVLGRFSPAEYSHRRMQASEIMSVFFYHLYRKQANEEFKRILMLMEPKTDGQD